MKVVILCGGFGTRAYPHTKQVPKALMSVSGKPIIEQVMRIYASQGFDEFVLAAGYLHQDISRYFESTNWQVDVVDTGDETDTGGRIREVLDRVGDRFHATYCDGLGDLDLGALTRRHNAHGGAGTMTATPLRSQYGILEHDEEDRIVGFAEKPTLRQHWINAGFFMFEREAYAMIPGENLERDILPQMSDAGGLYAYRHDGFWRSMDTFKDQQELDQLWLAHSAELDDRLRRFADGEGVPAWLMERYELISKGT